MNIGLLPAQRILVIAPHPDDESLGCGGTIARYTRSGATVELVVVSDGAALEEPDGRHEDVVAARLQEITAAAAILGIQQMHPLSLPDGQLALYESQIRQSVYQHLTTFQPDLVLTPSLIDGHADHVAVGRVILQLFRELAGWQLAFYEVLVPLRFNWLVDITEVMKQKETAVCRYQRSLFGQPTLFSEAFRALNLFKSAFVHHPGFFEALWVLQAPPTDQEVIEWATYGFQPQDGEQFSLWSVKGIDEVLFALREQTTALTVAQTQNDYLQQENAAFQHRLHEQIALNTTLQQTIEQQAREDQQREVHFPTWVRRFLRSHLASMFPVGSRGHTVLRRCKRRISQYTSKSPSE